MSYPSGPYRAEGNIIKSISHGKWSTVARVEKRKLSPEGIKGTTALLAAAPELLQALRDARMLIGMSTGVLAGPTTIARIDATIDKAEGK